MGYGHDTPTSTSFIETALFIPKANCINISAICTKHLLPDKQKRNLLHICNHHHDPRFILWGVWTGYTPWHHVRGAEQKGSQGHICTLRTHLYTADIFIHCRHIYTLRTHLYTVDIFIHCGHIYTLRTYLYTADIFIHCGHIYTVETILNTADTFGDTGAHEMIQIQIQSIWHLYQVNRRDRNVQLKWNAK